MLCFTGASHALILWNVVFYRCRPCPNIVKYCVLQVPAVPVISSLSMFINVYLMMKLSYITWIRFAVWLVLGEYTYCQPEGRGGGWVLLYLGRVMTSSRRGGDGGWVLLYLGMVGGFQGNDPLCWDFQSDWVTILWFITIRLTPSFCRN